MTPDHIIEALDDFSKKLSAVVSELRGRDQGSLSQKASLLKHLLVDYELAHHWFTAENSLHTLDILIRNTSRESLQPFLSHHSIAKKNTHTHHRRIAVIPNKYIPLAAFHDIACVLLAGHHVIVKTDLISARVLRFLVTFLNEDVAQKISIIETLLSGFDAMIAHIEFEQKNYYSKYFFATPLLLHFHKYSSVGIITGKESDKDLLLFGKDIFTWFGRSAYNISKVFFPEGYDMKVFFEAINDYNFLLQHFRYANHYEYNRFTFLMNKVTHLDNDFMLLRHSKDLLAPIGVLNFEYYTDNIPKHDNVINLVTIDENIKGVKPGLSVDPSLVMMPDFIRSFDFLQHLE